MAASLSRQHARREGSSRTTVNGTFASQEPVTPLQAHSYASSLSSSSRTVQLPILLAFGKLIVDKRRRPARAREQGQR